MHRGSGTPSADQQRSDLLQFICDTRCHRVPTDGNLLSAMLLAGKASISAQSHVSLAMTSSLNDLK
jgi:hypothetical protein